MISAEYTITDLNKRIYNFAFDYLKKKYVKVSSKNITTGVVTNCTYGVHYVVVDKTVELLQPVGAVGDVLRIVRETSTSEQIVSWNDASILKASDMSLSQLQQLHILEEYSELMSTSSLSLDINGQYDAKNSRIVNLSAPQTATDAVNRGYIDSFIGTLTAAQTSATLAQSWAVGDILSRPEGSSKYWSEQSKKYVEDYNGFMQNALLESTGYGIIRGGNVTVSNMTATVNELVAHMPDGKRYESAQTTITIQTADATNPRIDLIYLSSAGVVSYLAGVAAASPVVPNVPNGGLALWSINVTKEEALTLTDIRIFKPRYQNVGFITPKDFGAIGDGITDDTIALQGAVDYAGANNLTLTSDKDAVYAVSSTITAKKTTFIHFNMATIKAISAVSVVFCINQTNVNSSAGLSWYGDYDQITIDCNSMADIGLLHRAGCKVNIRDIIAINVNKTGIKASGGYEIIGDNWHVTGNGTSKDTIGVDLVGGDCNYSNIVVIDCYMGMRINGQSRVRNFHAWILNTGLLQGSTCIYCPSVLSDMELNLEDIYIDTYEYNIRMASSIPYLKVNGLIVLYNSALWSYHPTPNMDTYVIYYDNLDGQIYTKNTQIERITIEESYAPKWTNMNIWYGHADGIQGKWPYYLPDARKKEYCDNMLLNANFSIRQNSVGMPNGWGYEKGSDATISATNVAYDATVLENAFSITYIKGTTYVGVNQFLKNIVKSIAGKIITFSFWAKSVATGTSISIGLLATNDLSQVDILSYNKTITTSYAKYVVTFDLTNYAYNATYPNLKLYIGLFPIDVWSADVLYMSKIKLEDNIAETPFISKRYEEEINVVPLMGTTAPTSGTYALGTKVFNSNPVAGSYEGWLCTTAGSPGTWKGYGFIQS